MPRLGIINMMMGFGVLTLAAAAGAFVANDITIGYLRDEQVLSSWELLLFRSSHGHTNLFGLLHVALGLTLPYSVLSPKLKVWQTIGLFLGVIAMGPGMILRAKMGPVSGLDITEVLVGVLLSCALLAIGSHCFGLAGKVYRRQ